jgi:hypothetical protein
MVSEEAGVPIALEPPHLANLHIQGSRPCCCIGAQQRQPIDWNTCARTPRSGKQGMHACTDGTAPSLYFEGRAWDEQLASPYVQPSACMSVLSNHTHTVAGSAQLVPIQQLQTTYGSRSDCLRPNPRTSNVCNSHSTPTAFALPAIPAPVCSFGRAVSCPIHTETPFPPKQAAPMVSMRQLYPRVVMVVSSNILVDFWGHLGWDLAILGWLHGLCSSCLPPYACQPRTRDVQPDTARYHHMSPETTRGPHISTISDSRRVYG